MFQVARHTRTSAVVGYRSAAVTSAADWARGLRWDSIDGVVGCSADSAGLMAYTRCTTVQTLTSQSKEISVVISPTGQLVTSPETVIVYRTAPRPASPFYVN